jgi:hypothetical protein
MALPALLGLIPAWLFLVYLTYIAWFRIDLYQHWINFCAGIQWHKIAKQFWLSIFTFWTMRIFYPLMLLGVTAAILQTLGQ